MKNKDDIKKKQVFNANIDYHTKLAKNYNQEQPQYYQENLDRVRNTLIMLAKRAGNTSLCDLGCGTGFILDLAYDLFEHIHGVDITEAMMNEVKDQQNLHLTLSNTENLPFLDNSFNVMTGYGFLHHLYDLEPTLKQVYRCLKPGGFFYSDSDPNMHFWDAMTDLDTNYSIDNLVRRELNGIQTEIERTLNNYDFGNHESGIVELAEFQKMKKGGFDPDVLKSIFQDIGFDDVKIIPEWFLGQGQILHEISSEAASTIKDFLFKAMPISQPLFKYLIVFARK